MVITLHSHWWQLSFSQAYRFPGSAGDMGDWTMVSFNFHQHASMGKWSGFIQYLGAFIKI